MRRRFYLIFLIIFFSTCFKIYPQKLIIRNDFLKDSSEIIKNYFNSDSLINACNKDLKKIDTSQTDMIIVYGFYLDNVEKNIRLINNYELPLKINLSKNDPLNFNLRFTFLFSETLRIKSEIDYLKSNLDKIFFVVALSTLFTGLYFIASRRKIINHVMGYLIIENGVFVLSLAVGNEMLMLVNLVIMLDIFGTTKPDLYLISRPSTY